MDNPFADLIPKKAAANPFAGLAPKAAAPAANPFSALIPKRVTAGPDNRGSDEARDRAADQQRFAQISHGAVMQQGSPAPMTTVIQDPSLPIGVRALAAGTREGYDLAKAPFDTFQRQAQRVREGGELTPGDAGDVMGAAMAGGLKEAPGGAHGVPKPEAPKPRVEPPPLSTARAAPAANPFESLIPRNPEGRPVVPLGGLNLEPSLRNPNTGKNVPAPKGLFGPLPDPRAAAAGEKAVAKVADRASKSFFKNEDEMVSKRELLRDAARGVVYDMGDGSTQRAADIAKEHYPNEVASKPAASPWGQLVSEWKAAHETPDAKKALKADSLKAMLAENYHGVPAKPDANQKQAMSGAYWKDKPAAPKIAAPKIAAPKSPVAKQAPSKPLSPFDQWYEDVGKPGKHGEGLDMSLEARVQRAKKQGFNTGLTLYHGTGKSDFLRFDVGKHQSEEAIFLTDDPKVADAYSHKGGAPSIIPVWSKTKNPKTIDWAGEQYSGSKMAAQIKQAKAEGHDALFIKNMVDIGSKGKPQNQYAFFKPGNLRSKLGAAFEPKIKEPEAHLLSSASTPTADLLHTNKADYEDKLPKAPGAVQLVKQAGQTLKAILAPETLNESATRAAASIRKNIGRGVQDSERAKVAMEPYRKMLQNDTLDEQLTVLKWLQQPDEKIAKGLEPSDELKPFLQAFRELMVSRRIKLESRIKTGDMSFKDDYVSQMWRDPDAARDVLHSLGPKEGSNSFTKRSVIEDYEAGIRAGLIPLTTDPIEIAMRYVENVDRFVAINDVLEEGAANKDVVWRAPEHAPNGWVKLEGRARSFKGGAFQDAYAPPGYADVYNAFVSKPPQGRWGDVLGAAQKTANSVSAFKLALSGYHALNIAGEANVAGLANAIDKLAGGDVLGAAKGAVGAPAKFVTSVARGRQMLNTYLSGMGSPEMQKVVKLAVDANFRIAGKGRVADEYRFSALGSLWDSWKKGLLKGELKAMGRDIKERPLVGTAKAVVSTAARALETMSDPLFKHYIPMVKNGAYFDMVKTWLDAHPIASPAEQSAFARKASDIIDNRFGEMNQDNIFWQRWQKQAAQAAVVSYSYELGTARLVAGAAKDAVGLAKGKGWSPNLSYAIALPVMIGMMGAAYQYMKTGKAPEGLTDAMYPRTGGADPMSGQPARAVLPSYMSQFVNAYFGGLTHEIANKKNGIFDLLNAAWTGTDWRGDPITAVDDSTTQAIKKWLEYAAGTWEPILTSQTKKGGTGISGGERFMGIREAPMFAHDPQAYKRMMDSKRLQADAEKAWHDRNAALEAKGQHPNFIVKRQFIRDYMARHKQGYGGTSP